MWKIIFFVICLFVCNAYCAVLQGFGEVEGCYKFPDKSIPTCDGSAYGGRSVFENYCYIPALGCNMLVITEGVASYEGPAEYSQLYETVAIMDINEYEKIDERPRAYMYCRMIYPYEGFYVGWQWGISPSSETSMCGGLFNEVESYDCYQNTADADDPCSDDFVSSAYYSAEQEEMFLSALFATEIISEIPCEIGVSKLMTSTGLAFQLYAEQYTEPSLVVQYNDQKCYGKLELGNVTGAINIKYNDVTYHTVQ